MKIERNWERAIAEFSREYPEVVIANAADRRELAQARRQEGSPAQVAFTNWTEKWQLRRDRLAILTCEGGDR